MEIADIESKISAAKSRIRALKDETKSCMWFDGAGAMKISDPKRQEALNTEINRLEGLIEHDTPILTRLRSIVGDRSVSGVLDEAKIQFAENRIVGIRAELDHALKLQVAHAIGIDADHIVLGDHLFYQAGRETVGQVLKGEEFTKLQMRADKEVSELRRTIMERSALRDLVNGTFSEFKLEAV